MDALEIGGDFDWRHRPYEACHPWPASHTWYSLGREALRAAVCQAGSRHVWLPGYFCRDAVLYLEGAGYLVSFYHDSPVQLQPSWDSLNPQPGDAVVAVNYFGSRSGEAWRSWPQKRPDVVLVEDHTHDPFSPWACASTAHFAFASARKTLPIPDGGILWSPSGRELPARASACNWLASTLKAAGMVSKSIYLDSESRSAALKHTIRWLLKSGDQTLCLEGDAWPFAVGQAGSSGRCASPVAGPPGTKRAVVFGPFARAGQPCAPVPRVAGRKLPLQSGPPVSNAGATRSRSSRADRPRHLLSGSLAPSGQRPSRLPGPRGSHTDSPAGPEIRLIGRPVRMGEPRVLLPGFLSEFPQNSC